MPGVAAMTARSPFSGLGDCFVTLFDCHMHTQVLQGQLLKTFVLQGGYLHQDAGYLARRLQGQ